MEKVFEIPTALMGEFNKKFNALEKIATKLNLTGYVVEDLGTEVKEVLISESSAKFLGVEEEYKWALLALPETGKKPSTLL